MAYCNSKTSTWPGCLLLMFRRSRNQEGESHPGNLKLEYLNFNTFRLSGALLRQSDNHTYFCKCFSHINTSII